MYNASECFRLVSRSHTEHVVKREREREREEWCGVELIEDGVLVDGDET